MHATIPDAKATSDTPEESINLASLGRVRILRALTDKPVLIDRAIGDTGVPRERVLGLGLGIASSMTSPPAIAALLSRSWGRPVGTAELAGLIGADDRGAPRAVLDGMPERLGLEPPSSA